MPEKKQRKISGYAVSIYGFIVVPSNDMNAQINTLTAVKDAIDKNDAAGLVALMKVDDGGVSQKFVSRYVPIETPEEAAKRIAASPALPLTSDGTGNGKTAGHKAA